LRTYVFMGHIFKIRRDARLRHREKAAARELHESSSRRH
jgi:hypothetical protein